jgi:4-hydroxy-3-polyprenylbenzoate decarboxylase
MDSNTKRITLAFTGASGAQYGIRLFEQLCAQEGLHIHLVFSKASLLLLAEESDWPVHGNSNKMRQALIERYQLSDRKISVYGIENWNAPIASGTGVADAMVICPCTVGSMAAISQGLANDLLTRAAEVTLKEQRKLILVVRETPFSLIQLRNMTQLAEAGAVILPANPGFYHHPKDLDDIYDYIVGRILDQLGLANTAGPRWGAETK